MRHNTRSPHAVKILFLTLVLALSACTSPASSDAPSEPATAPDASEEENVAAGPESTKPSALDGEPIKLGAVLNLTTGMALYGTPMMNGVEMALDHQNEAGGINGRPIELVVEDAADSPTTGINALNKVLESDPLALVGPILGFQMIPFREIIDQEQVPIISLSGTRGWTLDDNQYAFRTAEFDGNSKPALTDFVVEKLGAEKIGLLVVANEWGHSGRDHVTAHLRDGHGLEPVAAETYQTDDNDMSAQLLNLKNAGADVIIQQGHPQDTALIMKQMKQLNIDIPLIASSTGQTSVNLDITQPEDVQGLYVQTYALPSDDPDPQKQEWAQEYHSRFDAIPDAYALAQYDGVMTLFAAMERAEEKGNLTRQGVTDEMWDLEYTGLITTYKADHEGNMMRDYIIVRYGQDKTGEIIEEIHVAPEDTIYELPKE